MEADKDYIFINYSRKDLTKVSPIVEEMRANGYNVWYDANILPGKDWPDYIAAHIKNCAVCVAFHSQASRDSQHCREEIHYALKHKKTVISVYLEDVMLKEGLDMQLARFQALRYSGPVELLEALRKSPDFKRCGENVSELPSKLSMKTALKKNGQRILSGLKFFFRKIFFPLCAVTLLVAVFVAVANYKNQPFVWFFDDENGVLDIVSLPFLKSKMPDYYYELGSTSHLPPWREKSTYVRCAVIRKGITHIGASSFQSCLTMEFVSIPKGVTSIGKSAFLHCISLKSVSFPDSVTTIDKSAFSGCSSLERISFPNSVTTIDEYAFSNCTTLKQVLFSTSIWEIAYRAFDKCGNLKEITIPNSIGVIGANAFSGCSNLKTIHIQFDPEKVQIVEDIRDRHIFLADALYIDATAFEPGTKIIYEPPDAGTDAFEYVWGSD